MVTYDFLRKDRRKTIAQFMEKLQIVVLQNFCKKRPNNANLGLDSRQNHGQFARAIWKMEKRKTVSGAVLERTLDNSFLFLPSLNTSDF